MPITLERKRLALGWTGIANRSLIYITEQDEETDQGFSDKRMCWLVGECAPADGGHCVRGSRLWLCGEGLHCRDHQAKVVRELLTMLMAGTPGKKLLLPPARVGRFGSAYLGPRVGVDGGFLQTRYHPYWLVLRRPLQLH